MLRYTVVAGCVLLAAVSVAAPVPKDKESAEEKLKRVFGTKIEPEDTSAAMNGDTLRISVPAHPSGKPGKQTELPQSPRTAREVTGEFTLTVKVRVSDPADKADVTTWAGVYLMAGEKDYVAYKRYFDYSDGKGERHGLGQLMTDGIPDALPIAAPHIPPRSDTAVLRIARAGGTVTMHTDLGDGKWGLEAVAKMPLPDKVTVGVYLGGKKGPYTAEFEEFTLKPAK